MDKPIEQHTNELSQKTQPPQPVQADTITLDIHDAIMTQEEFFGDYLEKGLRDG